MSNPYFPAYQEILDTLLSFLPPAWRANQAGKVLKRLLVAYSVATEALYALLARLLRLAIISTSEGEWLRALVAGFAMGTYGGVRATVVVRFARFDTEGEIPIPLGTQAAAVFGQVFEVQQAVTMPAGVASVDIPCACLQPGTEGNIRAGEIIALLTPVPGIVSVTNPNPAVGGRDAESDAEIKARVPAHLASLHRATIPATEGAIALNRDLFPEVLGFITQRNYGVPGYFRAVLSDLTGGNLYRPVDWVELGLGVYFVTTSLPEIYGVIAAGWPCKRFGVVQRTESGEEIWVGSPFVKQVEEGDWRWCHDRAAGRLYVRSDGSNVNSLDITIYAGVTWRALRELETNWAANGIGVDVIVPFVVVDDVSLTYALEPGYLQLDVENNLRTAVSDYVASLQLGQEFELEGLYAALSLVLGAAGVLVTSPTTNITVPSDSVFRMGNPPSVTRRAE